MRKYKNSLILIFLAIVGIMLYLLYGVTQRNSGYVIPLRINKIYAILLVSYAIGHSSVVFQTVANNKILTPNVMGLDALYLFIQTIIVFFFQSKSITPMKGNVNFIISIVCMIGFTLILNKMFFNGKRKSVYLLLLGGMVLGTFFRGLSSYMQVLLDPNEFMILQGRMFASFSKVNTPLLTVSFVITVCCFLVSIKDYKKLDVLSLGPEHAINLGIEYDAFVRKSLIIVAILVSLSTALVGPITFLGILVVSLARQIGQTYKNKTLVFLSSILSVIFLMYGLFITERIFNMQTTLSVIINFIGGIYFILYIIKEGKK